MMLFLPSLDILTCNSANKQSFQNLTKGLFAECSIDVKSEVIFKKGFLSDFEKMLY